MSCPTCDHTMESLGMLLNGDRYWHCPRCGTIKFAAAGHEHEAIIVPELVKRCREFQTEGLLRLDRTAFDNWRSRGIAESINVPEERQ